MHSLFSFIDIFSTMKYLLAALLIALSFTVTSCKKDYNCDCNYSGGTDKLILEKKSKQDAEDKCDESKVALIAAGNSDVICALTKIGGGINGGLGVHHNASA